MTYPGFSQIGSTSLITLHFVRRAGRDMTRGRDLFPLWKRPHQRLAELPVSA